MIETSRLLIRPLNYEQLVKYLAADNSLESELNLLPSARSISPELKEALEQTIMPNVADLSRDFRFNTIWTAISKEAQKMVGDLCIIGEPNAAGEIEIGYGTYEEFQGKGYMTEIVAGITQWAGDQPGVTAVIASTEKDNVASYSVLQKNNFLKVGETAIHFNWKKTLLFLLLFIFNYSIQAQSWTDTLRMIDNIMARYKPELPGCELAISRNGYTIFSKAYGMADLEHAVPLTTNSVIEAGSVSKQFTAAAILLLEQQGKLTLEDDVHKYIPELPDYGAPITLRHMMQHTSGLKDWGTVAAIAGWPRSTKTYSNADALEIIARQKTLNHPPGEEYLYSNSNYNLFAIIVERVTGQSLSEFTRIHLFEPAGMTHTEWRNDFRKVVRNRAIAYEFKNGKFHTNMPNEYVYGNGGLLTTAEDLIAWNNFYTQGKLGQPALFTRQIATSAFNNGTMGNYGAGLRVDTQRGWKIITHGGATASYRANLDYFPDLGLSIAWISNTDLFDYDPIPASTAIRNLLVKNISTDTRISGKKPVISDSALFLDLRDGNARNLPVVNGKPVNAPAGNWVPVAEAKTDAVSLQQFTGAYYSADAASQIRIQWVDGKLVVTVNPANVFPLIPICKDGFKMPGGYIHFTRNKNGRVTGCTISVNRARKVPFTKTG